MLNVTVPDGRGRRGEAATRHVTISSVVEAALAEQLKWYKIRPTAGRHGGALSAVGYPIQEETAAAAWTTRSTQLRPPDERIARAGCARWRGMSRD